METKKTLIVMEKIEAHLIKQNYDIKLLDKNNFVASNAQNLRMVFTLEQEGLVVDIYLTANDYAKKHISEMLTYVNDLNHVTLQLKCYVDRESILVMETRLPIVYQKSAFQQVLININIDVLGIFNKHKSTTKFFSKK